MAREALIFLVLLLSSLQTVHASDTEGRLIIYEVSPYSYSGEHVDYVCIANAGAEEVDLSGYFLTDFEGYLRLKGVLDAGERIYIAENSTSFFHFFGRYPDYTYGELEYNGTFALANSGDEVALVKNGRIEDIVIYGKSDYSGPGWHGPALVISEGHILRRKSMEDTDSPDDWTTYHRIGQSDFQIIEDIADVEVFALPDSRGEIFRFIAGARESLDVEMYTLTSLEAMESFLQAMENGARLRILLEGSPVGGISPEERFVVQRLHEKGAEIYFMVNGHGHHNRYSFVHSKFIVRDYREVLILTENLDASSLSPCGNRGFGVIVRSRSIAEYVERVFRDDVKAVQDIWAYSGEFKGVNVSYDERIQFRRSRFSPVNFSARVRFVLSPDYSSSALREFVDHAKSLDVEALYIKGYPLSLVYPKASRILVQFPLEGYGMRGFNGERENLRLLHAKLLIGDQGVLVGSMNFGNTSVFSNRELSVILLSEHAVKYFREVFEHDWNGAFEPVAVLRVRMHGGDVTLDLGDSVASDPLFTVYVDGAEVYRGQGSTVTMHLAPGRHVIKVVLEDRYGRDVAIRYLEVPRNGLRLDPIPVLYALIFAAFLYKLWKDHG